MPGRSKAMTIRAPCGLESGLLDCIAYVRQRCVLDHVDTHGKAGFACCLLDAFQSADCP